MNFRFISILCIAACTVLSCKTDPPSIEIKSTYIPVDSIDNSPLKIPPVNADTIYGFIESQVNFGPRVPGSDEHLACRNWIGNKLQSFGGTLHYQEFQATLHDGTKVPASNIIAQFNPKHKRRIVLSAHWDSRMVGDHDPDPEKRSQPILGADDGGSGVGVLLEVARLIQENPINMGIDIVLFDVEDQGKSGAGIQGINTWCLGSQYWSKNLYPKNYSPMYGILLDMVGAKDPQFCQDESSLQNAGEYMLKIWSLAQAMGYSKMFVNTKTRGITDDHVFVNNLTNIPMLDILNYPAGSGFQKCWHTHCDDMSVINKKTIRAVAQVLVAALYKESRGKL